MRRCGAIPGDPSPARDGFHWSFRDASFFASPALVGNRLYITSAQRGISKSGKIYCFDADSGAPVWSVEPDGFRPTFSSPVIVGDYLVCGEGLHDTRDARVVCLSLKEEGKVLWTFRTNNHVECTPVIADGRVYFGAGDDGVYCLDLAPRPDGQAKLNWHKPTEDFPDAETSLAVHDGKVYVGLGNDGAALVVLDAKSGDELHRLKMPYPVFSPASIADGRLYLGMGNGDYVKPGEGGEVRCLDLQSMKTLWTFPLPQTVLGAVAVKEGKLYFGCNDHHLYCLSRDGKPLAKPFDVQAPIKTSPAVTDEHVFVVSEAGRLYALDRHRLEPLWDYLLGTSGYFFSSPVAARGHIYVGTESDGLLCIGRPASTKRTPLWAAPFGGPGVAGNSDSSALPEAGELLWSHPHEKGQSYFGRGALWEDRFYLARTGAAGGLECLALPKEGKEPPRSLWTFPDVVGTPVLLGKTVACLDSELVSEAPRNLYFIDRETGALVGQRTVGARASGRLTATRHQFLCQDDVKQLSSFDTEGHKTWSAECDRLVQYPVANDAMLVVLLANPYRAIALDQATGAELWRVPLDHRPVSTPLLEKNTFLLPTERGIELRSLVDGQLLSSLPAEIGAPSGEFALDRSIIIFVNTKGEVIAFDRAADKLAARVPGALPEQTPLVSRGKVIYAAEGRIMTFSLGEESPTPELWMDLSSLHNSIDPSGTGLRVPSLLLRDSRLYTILPSGRLVCIGRPQ